MGKVAAGTTQEIDRHVDRLLADLRGLPPPLPLDAVRELLRIDLNYYSTDSTSALGTMVHRIRIAKRQLEMRPRLLLDVVRKLDLRALWLPDQRRILIDADLPKPKQRWASGHEIIHSILPWHDTFVHGDREGTLAHDCHEAIEAEANYGTSRLLFMGKTFAERAPDLASTFDGIHQLSKTFGNSLTSTLWRCVVTSPNVMLGVVSESPFAVTDQPGRIRHIFCSPSYQERFGEPEVSQWQARVTSTVVRRSGGPCGEREHVVYCSRGEPHRFIAACFNTQHAILTTVRYVGAKSLLG
jgi:hypothetical protein